MALGKSMEGGLATNVSGEVKPSCSSWSLCNMCLSPLSCVTTWLFYLMLIPLNLENSVILRNLIKVKLTNI